MGWILVSFKRHRLKRSNAKECINAYLNSKNDRAEAKLVNLLTGLLKEESLTQNNDHRTNYRQALIAINECAQERNIDISRLVNVLPIEDLDRGIIAPQITRLVTGTSPENYVEAINGFHDTINSSYILPEKKPALLKSIEAQLAIAQQFRPMEATLSNIKKAHSTFKNLQEQISKNKKRIYYLNTAKPAQTDKETEIESLVKTIKELEETKTEAETVIKSCSKNVRLWKQWRRDPLSVQINDIPQLPALLPTEPKIHPLERSKTT